MSVIGELVKNIVEVMYNRKISEVRKKIPFEI
jgi:hypothetical protein